MTSSSGSGAERRAHVRLPLTREVDVSWGGETRRVRLEDVSLSGAGMRLSNPPPVGTRIVVGKAGQEARAEVVRVVGDLVGLRFESDEAALGYVMSTVLAKPRDD
jgi:hypothetical protein